MKLLRSRYLVLVTIFFLISLIRSEYDVVIGIAGILLVLLGIVSYDKNK